MSALLLESGDQPVAVVDRSSSIHQVNARFEQLVGRPSDELVGRSWIDRLTPPELARTTSWRLTEAFRASRRTCECTILLADGRRAALLVDVARVGEGADDCALVLSVREWRLADNAAAMAAQDATTEYSISVASARLVQIHHGPHDLPAQMFPRGAACFEVLAQRDSPCRGCPALELTVEAPGPRRSVLGEDGDDDFTVVTAYLESSMVARVRSGTIRNEVWRSILAAKIERLADRRGLSAREREVLRLMVSWHTTEEIAETMGISVRTVKFHHGRALEKLGADSRLDLLRLLF